MISACCVDCLVFRPADALSRRKLRNTRGVCPRCPESHRETTELFIFTPPGAAIRFADGARKSFSIATCLAQ
jgi:hypothetical protein